VSQGAGLFFPPPQAVEQSLATSSPCRAATNGDHPRTGAIGRKAADAVRLILHQTFFRRRLGCSCPDRANISGPGQDVDRRDIWRLANRGGYAFASSFFAAQPAAPWAAGLGQAQMLVLDAPFFNRLETVPKDRAHVHQCLQRLELGANCLCLVLLRRSS